VSVEGRGMEEERVFVSEYTSNVPTKYLNNIELVSKI
jgi:hypothetical protein